MKKKNIGLLLLSLSFSLMGFQVTSQHVVESGKFNISFTTTEVLEPYQTESDSVLGYENENFAVDIAILPLELYLNELQDLKQEARQMADDFGLTEITEGQQIPGLEESFYVMGYDFEEDEEYPVFALIIINRERKIVYEITIDCYSMDQLEGKKIADSFKLLK